MAGARRRHPQEGIVQGHFHPTDQQKVQKLGQLRTGVPKVIEDAAYSPCLPPPRPRIRTRRLDRTVQPTRRQGKVPWGLDPDPGSGFGSAVWCRTFSGVEVHRVGASPNPPLAV